MDLVKTEGYIMPKMLKIWTRADENYGHEHQKHQLHHAGQAPLVVQRKTNLYRVD
jgi:hypothetical protein